ncbi:MAG: biotin/lipoyl-binding protein [Chitinophagaceae bacterium]|nr:biotin/lipoyl-binding protein [Chitinophagaceae bacterium]
MYKTTILGETKELDWDGHSYHIQGKLGHLEIHPDPEGGFLCTLDGQKIIADLVKIDEENKSVTLRILGKKIQVQIQEPVDLLLESLGMKMTSSKKVNQLKAPMPGLVLKILVTPGQQVKAGEPLMVLEAMKMENVFKAPADLSIRSIPVEEKQAVEKGQELMVFE